MTALVELYQTDHLALVRQICKTYGINGDVSDAYKNPHRERRAKVARRLRLYRDAAEQDVAGVIDAIYETEDYKQTLKRYIRVALEQNVTRRIVNEIANLYDRPAVRMMPSDQERFRKEEHRMRLHFVHQEAHRLTNVCNEVLVWQFEGANGPALRIVTPDLFDAIPHPGDNLTAAGFLLDMPPETLRVGTDRNELPHYEIWDDTYRYLISATGRMVDEFGRMVSEPERHGHSRIPGVLFHRREPTQEVLDAGYGSDIESCHLGIALLNVMIMRLSKSQGERQPVLQGNLAAMASGQVMNGERPLLLPPEVVASMLETKTDPAHYLMVKRDKLTSVAQSYGMSYEQFMLQENADSASAKAYHARREKLTELRTEQRARAVEHERDIVALMGFDPDELRLDFQEQAIPQDASEEVKLLDEKMRKGLDSPIAYIMRKDPDLSREDAIRIMKENLRDYAGLIQWVRALNVPSDADAANPGQSAQENGAMRKPNVQKVEKDADVDSEPAVT
jgi:hypothetical protein